MKKPLAADSTVLGARWRPYVDMLAGPLLMVALVAVLALLTLQVLGALRAREVGNDQFTQARQVATQALLRLAYSRQAEDWQTYRSALTRIQAARQARRILTQSDHPDFDEIRRQLTLAGRHPDDIATMLRMDRWLGSTWVPTSALEDWRRTDTLMAQLEVAASALEEGLAQGSAAVSLAPTVAQIRQLDGALQSTEARLAQTWGKAARTMTRGLMGGIVLISALLTTVSVRQIRRALQRQRQHHSALRAIHRRWELASLAAGLGFYQLDKATGTVELDGMAATLHGLGDQPLTMDLSQIRTLILADDAALTRERVDEALQAGHDHRTTYRVRRPDGQLRTLEAIGRLVTLPSGAAALVGVLRDVTDAVTQTEMAMQREAAERVARAQREFLSRLSHELRTPLNAILGFAQLLELDAGRTMTSPQHQQVQWILSAGRQLLALIEDVMDLTKVEAGEIGMHQMPVDVNALVRDCVPLLGAAAQQHGVTLLDRTATEPLNALADPQRLRQVLVNLLSNGCKYNHRGGHVTIDTRLDGADVVLEIADNGIGMRPEDIPTLFQPFRRTPAALAHAEGTGLGLYIVKQLVERMQGQVSLDSQAGVGSRFTVRLPRA